MVSFKDTLELLVTADVKGAVTGMQNLAKETDRSLTQAEGRLQKYQETGKKLMQAGVAGMGVGGFLTQLSQGDIEAQASLKAAVEATNGSWADQRDELEKAASSMAKFGHSDDDATQALSSLTLATGSSQKAMDLLQVTADYAAKKHISLADAASSIGKIFNGSIKPLKEYGIQVGLNADGTKNYAGAVDELGKKLTGQADAGVAGFGGELKKLRAEAENFLSGVGQQWGPLILGLSTGMTAAGGVMSGVTSVLGKLRTARLADAEATDAEVAANARLGVSSTGLVGLLGPLGLAVAGVAGAYQVLGDKADYLFPPIAELRKGFGGLQDVLQLAGPVGWAASKGIDALTGSSISGSVSTDLLANSQRNMAADAAAAADGVAGQTKSLKELADAAQKAEDKINAAAAAGHQLLDAGSQAQSAPIDIADAQAREADAKAKLGTGKTVDENAQLQRDYDRAQIETTRAINNGAQAVATYNEQQIIAKGGTVDNIAKNNLFIQALQGVDGYLSGPHKDVIDAEIANQQAMNDQLALQISQEEALKHGGSLTVPSDSFDPATQRASGRNQAFAAGGFSPPWSVSRVNELGLEMASVGGNDYLLAGAGGARISTAAQARSAMGGGGGDGGFHIHGNVVLQAASIEGGFEKLATRARIAAHVGAWN
jgi:hypothetical protein